MLMNSSQASRIDHLVASSRNIFCSIIAAATIFWRIFSRYPFSDLPNLRRSSLTVKHIFSSWLKFLFARALREFTICPLYKPSILPEVKAVNFRINFEQPPHQATLRTKYYKHLCRLTGISQSFYALSLTLMIDLLTLTNPTWRFLDKTAFVS